MHPKPTTPQLQQVSVLHHIAPRNHSHIVRYVGLGDILFEYHCCIRWTHSRQDQPQLLRSVVPGGIGYHRAQLQVRSC